MTSPDTTIVLDLETPRTFQDVGGHDKVHLLGISLCGVYFYETDSYRAFRAEELPELEQYMIEKQPIVVGFNHLHFDFPVLQPYCEKIDLTTLPTVDIMVAVQRAEGIRLKLETIAQGTLLEGKSGDGLDAVRYYRQGEWEKLEKYCLDDVRITRDLYEYGKSHGRLYYQSAGAPRAIPVSWSDELTVEETLHEAWKHHQQVELTYRRLDDSGSPEDIHTMADIRGVEGDQITFYAHVLHAEITLPARFIQKVDALKSTAVHQGALF